jgi:terminase small subunit-like protein
MTFQTGIKGSPTLYTAELAERILRELLTGRSLCDVCKDDGMPSDCTVRTWAKEDREGFALFYREARKIGERAIADRRNKIFDWILGQLRSGRTLRSICRGDGMPVVSTVLLWARKDRARYDLAREIGYDMMADRIVDIADNVRHNWIYTEASDKPVLDHSHLAHSERRINAERWLYAKAQPKTYDNRARGRRRARQDEGGRGGANS